MTSPQPAGADTLRRQRWASDVAPPRPEAATESTVTAFNEAPRVCVDLDTDADRTWRGLVNPR
ncbi:hypothetical protein Val02_70270 [Virgisporangium aliadipatigenens]|uniref:Uncharacterized protein n=1 Tax=Virgisporangium aliadipatigenens TaxID=741659 RepID=A0A8J4DUA9_9ACTN|nr:hypothetical protein [Virgisporangium aliadipatigenens]GIJ50141.1 hypothetical protein Val02_70270 [Virgisporangium aliadipatigenens]